jgi:hypothetical protein
MPRCYRCYLGIIALTLTGCASHVQPSAYRRTDGQPTDAARVQSVLAQCKGEAAMVPGSGGAGAVGMVVAASDQTTRELSVLDACMARNGYLR